MDDLVAIAHPDEGGAGVVPQHVLQHGEHRPVGVVHFVDDDQVQAQGQRVRVVEHSVVVDQPQGQVAGRIAMGAVGRAVGHRVMPLAFTALKSAQHGVVLPPLRQGRLRGEAGLGALHGQQQRAFQAGKGFEQAFHRGFTADVRPQGLRV